MGIKHLLGNGKIIEILNQQLNHYESTKNSQGPI